MSPFLSITEVCDFEGGSQPPKSEWIKKPKDGFIRMLQIRDFTQPEKDNIEYIKLKNNTKVCKVEDILIGRYGASIGKICTGLEGAYNVALMKTIPDPKKLKRKYLFYILNSYHFQHFILNVGSRAAQAGFNKDDLSRFKIPLPPLKTQEHIASILDDAAALRDKTAQLLEEYDRLAQSIFLDVMKNLDGEKKTLAKISKINPRKSEIAKVPKDTVVTFLPMSSVSEKGEVELSDERTIKEVWTGYTYFSEDDVLFAKITPCMENGKSCIAKNLKNNIGFGSTEFHVLRPIKNVTNSEWLYNLIKTDRFKYIAKANMRGSAGQKRVPTDFFSKFQIRVPSIELQNQFAEKIALIEQQKELARQELKESEDLFKCLLQKAFKGELVRESEEV